MKIKRTDQIIEYMRTHGGVANVVDLCEKFGVSDMTIRIDLQTLENNKSVIRHYGGATLIQEITSSVNAAPFQTRLNVNQQIKMSLGLAAAEYLQKASILPTCNAVYIASGTTLYSMALQINYPLSNTTLVTDNVSVSQVLASHPDYTVISIGGQLILPSLNAVGHVAENMIRSFSFDYAFISAAAIDENGYIYNYNYIEAGTFTAVLESSRHIIVVADSTKFMKKTFVQLCQLKKGYTLITDSGISQDFYHTLVKNEVDVIVAP